MPGSDLAVQGGLSAGHSYHRECVVFATILFHEQVGSVRLQLILFIILFICEERFLISVLGDFGNWYFLPLLHLIISPSPSTEPN